jgi:single-strand DNA-binding protein
MSYQITGIAHVKNGVEQITEKLRKQIIVIKDDSNSQYPQYVSLEAINDKCGQLDHVTPGVKVTVHFNIDGREYNGKYFNTLKLWKVEQA